MSHGSAPNYGSAPAPVAEPYAEDVLARLNEDAAQIIDRYPVSRSALLPLLHLVQSVDGYISTRGIEFCAEVLGLTDAQVTGVATFYTQYKRHPNGRYTVGVCTNTLCAIMGGDEIWQRVSDHLGIGHDETTSDGIVTLERVECNAACDYAPVVMANWEFFDNQTPESVIALVDAMRAGKPVHPTRGADEVATFQEISRVLAGFPDGRAGQGPGAGLPSQRGTLLAKEKGWHAPSAQHAQPSPTPPATDAAPVTGGAHSSADQPGDSSGKAQA